MIGSLGEFASLADMPSEVTLRKMIAEHADFPIVSRGKNGVSYEIDFVKAREFVLGVRAKEELVARERAEQIREFGLGFLGEDAAATPEAGLSAKERKDLLEEELVAIKVAERRGALIRKASVEESLGTLLVWFRERGKSFSARLAKRVDVPRDLIAAIDALMEADQRELADRMERIADVSDDPATEDRAASAI